MTSELIVVNMKLGKGPLYLFRNVANFTWLRMLYYNNKY